MRYITVVVIGLLLIGSWYLVDDNVPTVVRAKLQNLFTTGGDKTGDGTLRALRDEVLAAEPRLQSAKSDWEVAVLLRNHAYSSTKVGPGSVALPFTLESYQEVRSGSQDLLCYGMSVLYSAMLQAFGLESRFVDLAGPELGYDTHTTVEVRINDEWVLQDPTFNIHWEAEGKPVGVVELRAAFYDGKRPSPSTDGFPLLPGRSVQEYYIPYEELLANVEIVHRTVFGHTAGREQSLLTIPPGPTWRYRALQSPLATRPGPQADAKYNWAFTGGLPKAWKKSKAATVDATLQADKVYIKTSQSNWSYQVWSPTFRLEPGHYQLFLDGTVISGGVQLSMLDVASDTFLGSSLYWQGQDFASRDGGMGLIFEVKHPMEVGIILSNWSFSDEASEWWLQALTLVKSI